MINIIFIGIIILIIIKELYENSKLNKNNIENNKNYENRDTNETILSIPLSKPIEVSKSIGRQIKNDSTVEYDVPKPWSKVVYIPNSPYPYNYFIKLKIPSLNDYESWKTIVPNLNFDPRSGDLIIPSKDEASALALANLISINFSGQLSLDNILEKNLIQISISKAKSHEVVINKLREQITENLNGSKFSSPDISFEKDLVNVNKQENNIEFSIDAYNGNDYAYI
jgi:hypothetical protein